jgi:uncharacterized protein (DUF2249 family)
MYLRKESGLTQRHTRRTTRAAFAIRRDTLALRELHMTAAAQPSNSATVDLRRLVPPERHATIFQRAGELAPGERFVLINDHDPKPLHYQLESAHPGQFSWTYLESGPAVWRIEIGRLVKAA